MTTSVPSAEKRPINVNVRRFFVSVGLASVLLAFMFLVLLQGMTGSLVLGAGPDQPVNILPSDGAIGVSVTPTLNCSKFVGEDIDDSHVASQWQITGVSDNYSSPVFDSDIDDVNLTQIAVPVGMLSDNTTYYWCVRQQDNHGAWSDWSLETSFTTKNHSPNRPVNVSPNDGAQEVSLNPELGSSEFSDPDEGDTHAASHWRITAASDNYSSPVFDSGTDNVSLESITVPSGFLSDNVTYYWQVRHQDYYGAWSDWSDETSFTTLNHAPDQPAGVSPVNGADVTIPVTLKSSDFADPDENDTHAASRWQITKTAGDYSNPICDRIELKGEELTSMTVDLGVLSPGVTYYWRVQHQDHHGAWSAWSAEAWFTPQNQPPAKPTDLKPTPGSNAVSLTPQLEAAFSDPDGPQDYLASEWQITTVEGNYDSPTYQHLSQDTSITIPEGILNTNTTYYWKVRHQDINEAWSEWSDEASFTTRPVVPPIKEGGIPFWVWLIVGISAAGITAVLVLWRRRAARQEL